MKHRLLIGFSFLEMIAGAFFVNGCKDTATDPSFVSLAEIRFADYHQIEPIQIIMSPVGQSIPDSNKTPTAMTYGIVTPYFTNLPTNRTAGETYHLVAIQAGSITKANPQGRIVASTNVTLFPGDKKTWLIAGNSPTQGGPSPYDTALFNDNPPANQPASLAYFRFLNVTPTTTAIPALNLVVGDPLNGMAIATNVLYTKASPYVGIPVPLSGDTSVTFYVVTPQGVVLSRLAGIGLSAGSYHTVTWGGQAQGFRIPDPTTGVLTLNDTTRIRILDDDLQGTDLTVTAPLTFRFNIINALLPPNSYPGPGLVDYTQSGGLAIVINNNTVYDYRGLLPFSLAPGAIANKTIPSSDGNPADSVSSVVPTTTPLVGKIIISMVKPAFKDPSSSDSILFRFFAGNGHPFNSDQLYAIVVFDSVKKIFAKQLDIAEPYDSAGGTYTVPIPDVPIVGSARIILGYMLAVPPLPLKPSTNSNAKLFVDTGAGLAQDLKDFSQGRLLNNLGKSTKTFDSSLVVPADGRQITLSATVSTDPSYIFKFTPQSGAIYEAFLVGQRGRKDDPQYKPRFVVIRINP